MNVLFAGSPEFAVPAFERVAEAFPIVGVLSAPDSAKGRRKTLTPTPVAEAAERRGIPVFKPQRLGRSAREEVSRVAPDILVCVAYGRIFGPKFLGLFPHGGINLHPSLLPRHRGPAPIPATILAGDPAAGITIQQLALKMDSGDIILQESKPLSGTETTGELTGWAAERGAELLAEALTQIHEGTAAPVPQNDEEATYCGLINSEDARIDWTEPADLIQRKVRAYNPWPKAFTFLGTRRIAVLEAVTHRASQHHGDSQHNDVVVPGRILGVDSSNGILIQTGAGILGVQTLKPQTRQAMSWRDFLNGIGTIEGECFSSVPAET